MLFHLGWRVRTPTAHSFLKLACCGLQQQSQQQATTTAGGHPNVVGALRDDISAAAGYLTVGEAPRP